MQNGTLMADIRKKLKLTQLDVSRYLKITLSTYKLYETGQRPMKIGELNALSDYFKVSLNTLLGISYNMTVQDLAAIDYKYMRFSLKYIRKINRVTQKELAKEFKVSLPMIGYLEKYPENMKADYLYKFIKKFHVSADYICGKTLKKEVL